MFCRSFVSSAVIVRLTAPFVLQSFPDALRWEVHVRRTQNRSQNIKGETFNSSVAVFYSEALFSKSREARNQSTDWCICVFVYQYSITFWILYDRCLMHVWSETFWWWNRSSSLSSFRRSSGSILKTSPGSWTVSAAVNVASGGNCRWDSSPCLCSHVLSRYLFPAVTNAAVWPVCCVQTQGLGTALKILFSEKEIQNLPEHSPSQGFQLTRHEIVALVNGFSRYVRRPAQPEEMELTGKFNIYRNKESTLKYRSVSS